MKEVKDGSMATAPVVLNPDCRVSVGRKTHLGGNIVFGPNCRSIEIGFGCFLGRDIYIDVESLEIGDYTTIHHGSVIHGVSTRIGHNCWFGHYTVIDSLGGDTCIGNGVGVGAHSQLWSHIKFGDVLAGCRWNSGGRLLLGDDVWLVGHCIVGPIEAQPRAMLMTGGVAMKNMLSNRVYAGAPAVDMTERFGPQFEDRALHEMIREFDVLKSGFEAASGRTSESFVLVEEFTESNDFTEFHLPTRSYRPRYTDDEYEFIKFMLYDKAKFVPVGTAQA